VLIDWELRLEIRKRSAKCSGSTRDAVRYILTVAELIIDPVRLRCAVLAVNILAVYFVGHTACQGHFSALQETETLHATLSLCSFVDL
jgi:hypothetical protein